MIIWRNGVDYFHPAELSEGPVHRCSCSFGCVTAAPAVTHQTPSHLRARPAFRIPRTQPSDPSTGRLLDDRKHGKALQLPRASHHHECAPCKGARLRAANEVRRYGIGQERRPGSEVLRARRPQQQSRSVDLYGVLAHNADFNNCCSDRATVAISSLQLSVRNRIAGKLERLCRRQQGRGEFTFEAIPRCAGHSSMPSSRNINAYSRAVSW